MVPRLKMFNLCQPIVNHPVIFFSLLVSTAVALNDLTTIVWTIKKTFKSSNVCTNPKILRIHFCVTTTSFTQWIILVPHVAPLFLSSIMFPCCFQGRKAVVLLHQSLTLWYWSCTINWLIDPIMQIVLISTSFGGLHGQQYCLINILLFRWCTAVLATAK